MFLVRESDRDVLKGQSYSKNAEFFVDLLTFADVYENVLKSNQKDLPNYVFHNDKYCLNGICLFIFNYQAKFGFCTKKLTLDYLKVLYYAMAGYVDDDGNFEKNLVLHEAERYSDFCNKQLESLNGELSKSNTGLDSQKTKYKERNTEYQKQSSKEIFFYAFALLFLSLTIVAFVLDCVELYYKGFMFDTPIVVLFLLFIIFGLFGILFCVFYKNTKKHNIANFYEMKLDSNQINQSSSVSSEFEQRRNYFYYEKYICQKFARFKWLNKDVFDEILDMATQYKLLSYNMEKDCEDLFETQKQEVDEMLKNISQVDESNYSELVNLYKQICKKDWLYYNQVVRIDFINQCVKLSFKSHLFAKFLTKIQENPFDIDVKKIFTQNVSFLPKQNGEFLEVSFDKLYNSKMLNDNIDLNLVDIKNYKDYVSSIYEILCHFFDNYNSIDSLETSDEKIDENEAFENKVAVVPMFLKYQLLGKKLLIGVENTNAKFVLNISSLIKNH